MKASEQNPLNIAEVIANKLFCLMTTFERISRFEVTTAAQVSSAEDSSARTEKPRLVGNNGRTRIYKRLVPRPELAVLSREQTRFIPMIVRQARLTAILCD